MLNGLLFDAKPIILNQSIFDTILRKYPAFNKKIIMSRRTGDSTGYEDNSGVNEISSTSGEENINRLAPVRSIARGGGSSSSYNNVGRVGNIRGRAASLSGLRRGRIGVAGVGQGVGQGRGQVLTRGNNKRISDNFLSRNDDGINNISSSSGRPTSANNSPDNREGGNLNVCKLKDKNKLVEVKNKTMKRLIDVIYTNIFLDIFNYERDKSYIFNEIFDFKSSETVLLICSPEIYNFIYYFERSNLLFGGNVILISTSMNEYNFIPATINHLILFNIDPFLIGNLMKGDRNDKFLNRNRFRSFFNSFVIDSSTTTAESSSSSSSSATAKQASVFTKNEEKESIKDVNLKKCFYTTKVHMIFNIMTIGERDIVMYNNNTGIMVECCIRTALVDNYDINSMNSELSRFCNDAIDCNVANDKSKTYIIEQDILPDLIRNSEKYLNDNCLILLEIKKNTNFILFKEYIKFKMYYYSFIRNKPNKWGIDVKDEYGTLWTYMKSMNRCLRDELKSIYRLLQRYVLFNIFHIDSDRDDNNISLVFGIDGYGVGDDNDGNDVGSGNSNTSNNLDNKVWRQLDLNNSNYMIEAKDILKRIYDSCPTVLNTINLRDIMIFKDNERGDFYINDYNSISAGSSSGSSGSGSDGGGSGSSTSGNTSGGGSGVQNQITLNTDGTRKTFTILSRLNNSNNNLMMRHNTPYTPPSSKEELMNISLNKSYIVDNYKSYDTITFPPGGNVMDPKVVFALKSRNLGVGDTFTVHQDLNTSIDEIRYNSFFTTVLFNR